MFLRQLDDSEDTSVTIDNASDKCQEMLEKIRTGYANGTVIENMYYHIVIGNDFIANESNEAEAKKHFKKVVEVRERALVCSNA